MKLIRTDTLTHGYDIRLAINELSTYDAIRVIDEFVRNDERVVFPERVTMIVEDSMFDSLFQFNEPSI